MATTTGPLFSFSAQGSLSNLLTFKKGMRGTVARKYAKPSGLPSVAQLNIRSINKQVSQAWSSVNTTDRSTWNDLAQSRNYSTFNAFFVLNFARVSSGLPIINSWPPTAPLIVPPIHVYDWEWPIVPNCLGTYPHAGEHNGQHFYKRQPENDFMLFLSEDWAIWTISLAFDILTTGNLWYGPVGFDDIYEPYGDYTGRLIVSF